MLSHLGHSLPTQCFSLHRPQQNGSPPVLPLLPSLWSPSNQTDTFSASRNFATTGLERVRSKIELTNRLKVTIKSQKSWSLGSRPDLRKCVLYVSIVRTFFTKAFPLPSRWCLAQGSRAGHQETGEQRALLTQSQLEQPRLLRSATWGAMCQAWGSGFLLGRCVRIPHLILVQQVWGAPITYTYKWTPMI